MRSSRHSDEYWMAKALDLARRGEGRTRPNPPVGAVVVHNDAMVGAGYHAVAGGPHAEVVALRKAGMQARGATLYVTLEPCCTYGRTPPCTDLIIRSGVKRVVIGTYDPNPSHSGRGAAVLRRKGIRVTRGCLQVRCQAIIKPFEKWITTGMPYVTLKMAMSLDGKIADAWGRSRWISSPSSRAVVQKLRRKTDAVLVGVATVNADDPSLLYHGKGGNDPCRMLRVIADTHGRINPKARVLKDAASKATIIAVAGELPAGRLRMLRSGGATVLRLPLSGGHVSVKALLRKLGHMGMLHVLCEGGGELGASLIKADVIDEFVFFVGAKVVGGPGRTPVEGDGWRLRHAPRIRFEEFTRTGDDLMIMAVPDRTTRGK